VSHIDDLIAEHCPEGAHHKALAEVTVRGSNIRWADAGEEEFLYIDLTSVDRVTRRIGATATIWAGAAPSRAQQIVRAGDVIFATTRPTQMRWAVIPVEYDGQIASTGYCVLRPKQSEILTKFLAHLLGTERFRRYVEEKQVLGNYPSIPDSLVRAFRVPVPPLEVQREIVRILGTFTELEAELEARQRQYAHYRDALLSFGERDVVTWATLGRVCSSVFSGGTPLVTRLEYYGGNIPWLRTQEVNYSEIHDTAVKITHQGLMNSSAKWVRPNSVIVAISGAGVTRGRVAINKIPLTTNQHCCNLEIDPSQANYRFVYHWLVHHYEDLRARGHGNRSDLNVGIIRDYPIAVPTLDEQERIASVLDAFDALVSDLSVGLPAELVARRSQYEYYRDRLLTFEEAVS